MNSSIILQVNKGVATITFNRPEKFNSFNKEMAFALQDALLQAELDEAVRCILITGQGKAFCAGQDLSEAEQPSDFDFENILEERYNPIIRKMRALNKPIICGVNGVAAGAGANIALAADIVIAKQNATFIQAFVNIGLIPDCGGTFFLPRLVGLARATALCLTGEKVNADDAVKMGMIYKSITEELFEFEIIAMAEKLALMPTKGIALTKQLLNKSFDNNVDQQLELEKEQQIIAGNTYDFNEGVCAFKEKRHADFKGK